MASTEDKVDAGPAATMMDDIEAAKPVADNPVLEAKQRGLEPPEIIRNMSPEERARLEKKLRLKIDLRLLPMIILMYILNYIDR